MSSLLLCEGSEPGQEPGEGPHQPPRDACPQYRSAGDGLATDHRPGSVGTQPSARSGSGVLPALGDTRGVSGNHPATVVLMPFSLVDWLRAQDDETLAELFRLRPDLAVPPPADMAVLAKRIQVRASIHRACEDLDTVTLAVLDALVVADADETPVPVGELRRLLGPDVDDEVFDTALTALLARALIWRETTTTDISSTERIVLVPGVRDAVPRYPGGLGRPASGPAASAELPELLAELEPDERRVLEVLAAGPPIGRSRSGADPTSPVGRLLARGLLVRIDNDTVELPRQVGLALRGDRPLGRIAARPPELPTRDRGMDVVDSTAGGAALELLRRVDRLLQMWGSQPPPVLRSGGLGVRDLRRTARELDVDEAVAAFLIELVVAADLVGESEDPPAEWVPTTASDIWAAGGREVRWSQLARTWLQMPRRPGLVGQRDDSGRPINALSPAVAHPLAAHERRRVLAVLAELPPGAAVESPSALANVLAWRAPRRGGRLRDEVVTWTLSEATVLGVVALDSLSTPGRVLLSDPDELPAALRATLPPPVDHVLVQADLTAIAPGPLEPVLEEEMALVADVESAGGATVYRFTEHSIRRALDSGRSAADIHALLEARSATPIPQSLRYLIDDVARRHGRLRGGVASAFLRSDDPVLIAEVMSHPVAAQLELRQIAPTVAVSPLSLSELIEGLREAGFAASAEDASGGIIDLAQQGRRTSPRARPLVAVRNELDPAQVEAVVARLRAGDAISGIRTVISESSANGAGTRTTESLEILREAVRAQRNVRIGYVDRHGVSMGVVLQPTSVGGGVVEGRDAIDGGLHRVPLHRITTIAQLED